MNYSLTPQIMDRILLLFSLLAAQVVFSQKTEIDSIVNAKLMDEDPAVFVGVVKDGEIFYRKIEGIANLQHMVVANENTRSNIASTAKQFTAMMILELSLIGEVNLEEDIRSYFPTLFAEIEDEIKIRHLINHTSGIRDYCDLMGLEGKAWWRRVGLDNDDVLDFISKQKTLAFKPGTEYEYSNTGYNILAELIAQITEESFVDYSKKFFERYGMNQTSFPKNYMQIIPNQALPYSDWGNGEFQEYPSVTSTCGAGFLFTTLDDQLHFEQQMQNALHTGNELFTKSQGPIPNSEIESYGYGLELSDRLGYKAVHHEGATGSYSCQMVRYPTENLSIFVMTNNSRIWSYGLADEIALLLLPRKTNKTAITYHPKLEKISNQKLIAGITGQYSDPSGELIRITEKEGEITWQRNNGNEIKLIKEAENLYHPYYDSSLKIGFFEDEVTLFPTDGEKASYPRIKNQEATLVDYYSLIGDYYNAEIETKLSITLEGDQLMMMMNHWNDPNQLDVANRNIFFENGYIIKVERDHFDRAIALIVSYGRALNNRFVKKSNLQFQPTIIINDGSISVTTVGSVDGSASDILLTKNYPNGNEIWTKQFGGSSYDKANSVIETEDGYLVIGSTSSYGKGNYDIFAIKTDRKGKKQWQKTYGHSLNEYGYTAEISENGFIIKGSIQRCNNDDVLDECHINVWEVMIDRSGNEISSRILEEI